MFKVNVQTLSDFGIPSHMRGGLVRYIEAGIPPGGFLTAVLDNDLKGACMQADDVNKRLIFEYCAWLYNFAPSDSWGYAGSVERWCKAHRGGREATQE